MERTFYDDYGQRITVDHRTPVDDIEPDEPTPRHSPHILTLMEKVAGTFLRGNPRITRVAWQFLLGAQSGSMRRHARDIGCTVAAISRRINTLSREFGMPVHNPHLREQRREITRASWEKRKRRADRSRPAVPLDEQPLTKAAIHE